MNIIEILEQEEIARLAQELHVQEVFANHDYEPAALARDARAAVGNDTGPLHLIAATGIPVVALFSKASDPSLCAPRGPDGPETVTVLRVDSLAQLPEAKVASALNLV